jgi:DNA-binding response OmpR family regulator
MTHNNYDNIQGKKILVVDDDDFTLKLVEETFARTGNDIYTAANGLEGLQIFYKQQPDLVILDVMMPVMDGLETCRYIRQSSNVPVIVLTALGREEDVLRGLACGADDYVTKPFSLPILMARAASAVRRAELPAVVKTRVVYDEERLTIDLE